MVLDFVKQKAMTENLAKRLQQISEITSPDLSTNEFASACMEGKDVDPEIYGNNAPCPFLDNNSCMIYEVRPFGCRCFNSLTKCGAGIPAEVSPLYLSAASAVQQLIEHLDQGRYWGNFFEIIFVLSKNHEYGFLKNSISPDLIEQAEQGIRRAIPLPGFLYTEEEAAEIEKLLESVFHARLGNRTIEDILNGK